MHYVNRYDNIKWDPSVFLHPFFPPVSSLLLQHVKHLSLMTDRMFCLCHKTYLHFRYKMFTVKPSQVIGCLSTVLHIDSHVGVSNPTAVCVCVCEWGFVRRPFMPAFQSLQQGPQGILTCK